MTIRAWTVYDAAAAAHLHATSITEGFLPTLGERFLTRLYRRIARDERSVLLVDVEGGRVHGMIAGTEDVHALYKQFARRDGVVAGLVAAPRIARHARHVLETWRYGRAGTSDAVALPPAELLAVAVAGDRRGAGTGHALVAALHREFTRRAVPAAKVVVGAGNEAALRLYERCGYREATTIAVHPETPSKVLVWSPSPR